MLLIQPLGITKCRLTYTPKGAKVCSSACSEHHLPSLMVLQTLHRDVISYIAGVFLQLKHTSQGDWGVFSTHINIVAMSVPPQQPSWVSTRATLLSNPSPGWATSRCFGNAYNKQHQSRATICLVLPSQFLPRRDLLPYRLCLARCTQ